MSATFRFGIWQEKIDIDENNTQPIKELFKDLIKPDGTVGGINIDLVHVMVPNTPEELARKQDLLNEMSVLAAENPDKIIFDQEDEYEEYPICDVPRWYELRKQVKDIPNLVRLEGEFTLDYVPKPGDVIEGFRRAQKKGI